MSITTHISFDIKKDNIKLPEVIHSDPTDYGLTREEVIHTHIRYLRGLKKPILHRFYRVKSQMMMDKSWFLEDLFLTYQKELIDIEREIKFQYSRLKQTEDAPAKYDLEAIKQVPCDSITQILSTGFFVNNPFRNEKSPSNSLHWNKKTNRWTDYGSGQHGDNLDLYMKINDCTFKEALVALSNR